MNITQACIGPVVYATINGIEDRVIIYRAGNNNSTSSVSILIGFDGHTLMES